jgi:hypothetical protein
MSTSARSRLKIENAAVRKLVQEVAKDKSGAFLNEASDDTCSHSAAAAFEFHSFNRIKAAWAPSVTLAKKAENRRKFRWGSDR